MLFFKFFGVKLEFDLSLKTCLIISTFLVVNNNNNNVLEKVVVDNIYIIILCLTNKNLIIKK